MIKGEADENVKSNNYKQYDESLVGIIAWIIESKKARFTLTEIKTLLNNWFNNKLTREEKIAIGNKKIREVNFKIKQLKEVRKFLLKAKQDVENGLC